MSVEDTGFGAALYGDALLIYCDAPALGVDDVGVELVHDGGGRVDFQTAAFLVEADFLRHWNDAVLCRRSYEAKE